MNATIKASRNIDNDIELSISGKIILPYDMTQAEFNRVYANIDTLVEFMRNRVLFPDIQNLPSKRVKPKD